MSGMLLSRSYRACQSQYDGTEAICLLAMVEKHTLAMLVSISEGEALEGELGAILLRAADMMAVVENVEVLKI